MKEYKSLEEQIEYLISNKKIDKETIDLKIFNETAYLNIITPYTDLIAIGRAKDEVKSHIYRDNTNFQEYLSWSEIDKFLSAKLHPVIGAFENKLKLYLERTICLWMFESGDKSCCNSTGWNNYLSGLKYLEFIGLLYEEINVNLFTLTTNSKMLSRKTAIENIIKIYNNEIRSTELIRHYRLKGYLPFWVVIHELTIHELIQIFMMIKYEDKKIFLSDMLNIGMKKISFNDVKKFESKLSFIIDIRNKINHYEPIIPFVIRLKPDLYNILFSSIKLICNWYKRVYKINISIQKPTILTIQNEYNKICFNRIVDIINLLDNM